MWEYAEPWHDAKASVHYNTVNDNLAIGNPERQVRKASRCGSKQQHHSVIACSCLFHMGGVLRAHPVRGELHVQRRADWEVNIKQ